MFRRFQLAAVSLKKTIRDKGFYGIRFEKMELMASRLCFDDDHKLYDCVESVDLFTTF